jgi:3-oxoacyl-(acyl-carrier-protein) synthase
MPARHARFLVEGYGSMSFETVVITGIGMITPIGATNAETVNSWQADIDALRVRSESLRGTVLESQEIALVPSFDPAQRLKNRKLVKFMSQGAALGCIAAHEAMENADAQRRFAAENIGLFAATGLAGIDMPEVMPMIRASIGADGNFSCLQLGSSGLAAANPLLSFKILANMPPCLASIIEGIKGPSLLFTPWEGQAGAALLEAWQAVATGEVECALAGGADNATVPTVLAFLRKAELLGEDECASAGAGYVVMERQSTALRDHRRIYARILAIRITPCHGPAEDPLAKRIGRTYAAAPALLLGLAAQLALPDSHLVGADLQDVEISLEKMS